MTKTYEIIYHNNSNDNECRDTLHDEALEMVVAFAKSQVKENEHFYIVDENDEIVYA